MATSIEERELTYDVPPGFRLPDLGGLPGVADVGDPVEVPLNAMYYDTPDLRLIRRGVTMRRRTGGHDDGWHLKRPRARHSRTETRVEDRGDGQDVPEVLDTEVRALRRGRPLGPVARIRTHRVERPVRDARGRTLAMVADDLVSSQALGESAVARQWRELEVELVDGSPELLAAADALLREGGARPARLRSKLGHALGVPAPGKGRGKGGRAPGGPSRGTGHGKGGRALLDYLGAQRDRLLTVDPGVRRGEPDAVHDMRVALRRLRSTLRAFRPLLDAGRAEPLRAELRWLGRQLGPVRDGDVLGERLATAVHAEPPELVVGPVAGSIRSRLTHQAAQDRTRLTEALDSPRYATLLDSLDGLLDDPPLGRVKPRRLRRRAARSLRRAERRLGRADRASRHAATGGATAPTGATATAGPSSGASPLGRHPDVLLHEARKAYRRARYAVEVLRPLAGRRARQLSRRLAAMQDVLGEHHDAIAAAAALREHGMHAHRDGANAFTYGLLHARQHTAAARALGSLPATRRRTTRPKHRRWLNR